MLGSGLIVALAIAAPPTWIGPRPARAARVVSLAPSLTEILFALGAGDRVVGVTRFDDQPAAAAALPKVGGFIDPEPEAVLALRPDLVVAVPTSGGRGRVDTLARLGVPALVLPGESVADLWVAIAALGELVERSEPAAVLTARLRAELAAVERRFARAPPLGALLVVGHRPLVAAGPGTFLDSLLSYVGAKNLIDRGGAYPTLDLEAVMALDPEVIVDLTASGHEAQTAFWQQHVTLRAVRSGRVITPESDALLRPGPRLPQGLLELGAALWPEAR